MSDYDPINTVAQERKQAEDAKRETRAAKQEIEDLKWLMADKRGRRFVLRLLERSGVWRISFDTNALVMAFREGNRNEGVTLVAKLAAHCPDRYADMLKEQGK
jgi:hypothetical protein